MEKDDLSSNKTELFINRELSLLKFNHRVLQLALDESLPLLERMKFIFICSSNLDEFFEVRVSGLKQKVLRQSGYSEADGLEPEEILSKIHTICHDLVEETYRVFNDVLLPLLSQEHIHFSRRSEWTEQQSAWVAQLFHSEVMPVLSPIGLDLAHPFPQLINKSLHFIIELDGKDAFGRDSGLAVVHMPRSLPRIFKIPGDISGEGDHFVLLSAIIHTHASALFPGMSVKGCYQFRLTRDSDLWVDEEEVEDLATALKTKLKKRDFGASVRLEVADNCPQHIQDFLLQKCQLEPHELYQTNGPVNLNRLFQFLGLVTRPDLSFKPFAPNIPAPLRRGRLIFDALKQKDILLFHPYDSFQPVIDFVKAAAADPDVLAIKQTFYRSGNNSEMVRALLNAARSGKEVTAVVELRARFDEQGNIEVATQLQDAGAQVVYGVIGHKTHAKMVMIVRREGNKLVRYVHLGTGNYHSGTAKLYTDMGLMTADSVIGEDVHKVFQQLTGMGKAIKLSKLLQSPFTLHKRMRDFIEREVTNAKAGKAARIILKMNSLTDRRLINALYLASKAGVKIDLIIRGICCLRPGVPGISENIRVLSIVGRFLEHTRIFYFYNDAKEDLYCSSADWMERNLYKRVEVCFPIEDPKKRQWVIKYGLLAHIDDNVAAWELQEDGEYQKMSPQPDETKRAAQTLLLQERNQL
ncbi:MAG: polyphosphate kinase 1 [Pseudomonadota bacterium]